MMQRLQYSLARSANVRSTAALAYARSKAVLPTASFSSGTFSFSSPSSPSNPSSSSVVPPPIRSSQPISGANIIPSIHANNQPPQGRTAPLTFSMQVVFLGYGVGKFELEMLRAAPQLISDPLSSSTAPTSAFDFSFTPSAPSFDLSAHPVAPPSNNNLKPSWASSRDSVSAARSEPSPRFSESLSLGQLRTPSTPTSSSADEAAASSPTIARGESDAAADVMPANTRIVVHSSVVVYQNCMFCWAPTTFSEITVDSLAFLKTLTPRPELLLIGTGSEIGFRLSVEVQKLLTSLNIGVELMDSGNAIATYNILTDEGRTVLAAMLKKPPPKIEQKKKSRSQEMRERLGYWKFE